MSIGAIFIILGFLLSIGGIVYLMFRREREKSATPKQGSKPATALDTSNSPFRRAINHIDSKITQEIDNNLDSNVEGLINKYDIDKAAVFTWWNRIKSDGRGKFLTSLNEEQRLVIEQAVMMEKAVIEGRKEVAEFNTYIAENANVFILLEEASNRKLTLESFNKVREQEEFARIEIEKSHSQNREIVRTAMLGKDLAEHQRLALLQDLVNDCYLEIARIEKLPLSQPIIDRMIADQEEQILTIKGDMRVRRNRLAQISDGENLRGSLSFTDVEGSDSEPT